MQTDKQIQGYGVELKLTLQRSTTVAYLFYMYNVTKHKTILLLQGHMMSF